MHILTILSSKLLVLCYCGISIAQLCSSLNWISEMIQTTTKLDIKIIKITLYLLHFKISHFINDQFALII